MRTAQLMATGAHHPSRLIPNAYFDERFGPGVGDWLVQNLSIEQRYWAEDGEATSDLCVAAARQALQRAGITPEQLDLIIVSTDTPDYLSPSTAAIVQRELGASRAGTFDVNAACSGFVIGLDIASKYLIADPRYRYVLVLGGYMMSRHLNHDDKKTATLFADGAGAVVLQAVEGEGPTGLLGGQLRTEGQYADWMGIYGGGTRRPVDEQVLADNGHKLVFAKRFPKEINPATWQVMIREQCEEMGISPADVDHYIFTQLNINSIWETLDALDVPRERGHTVMHKYGYTGSACIPMAFDDLVSGEGLEPGQLVCFIASGGGLSFAIKMLRV